jgi:hypothetical protein
MRHYAGLGVSLDKTSVSIIDEAGAFIAEAKVERRPLGLGQDSLTEFSIRLTR